MNQAIENLLKQIVSELNELPLNEKISTLNDVRRCLHEVSPFKEQPVDCILWVPAESVQANAWNPNAVAPPEMELLYDSISCDGFTQPVVAYELGGDQHEVVDGYHRTRIAKEKKKICDQLHNYLPIAKIDKDKSDRMASTIRHNRARGSHDVELMSNIVAELIEMGRSETWIAKHLGMDADEVLRLKQITGLSSLFKNEHFSKAWE